MNLIFLGRFKWTFVLFVSLCFLVGFTNNNNNNNEASLEFKLNPMDMKLLGMVLFSTVWTRVARDPFSYRILFQLFSSSFFLIIHDCHIMFARNDNIGQ